MLSVHYQKIEGWGKTQEQQVVSEFALRLSQRALRLGGEPALTLSNR
jgi:hypothetical protein